MMNRFDLTVFHDINQHAGHSGFFDTLMAFIAQYSLEMYALLFVIAWFALPRREVDRRHGLVLAVFGAALALIVNMVIGAIWYRPRPFVALNGSHCTKLIPHVDDASFPSDHVSVGFGIASGSWGAAASWFSWSITIVSLVVMFARVYCGVHWPTDVIAGLVVGVVCGRVVHLFSKPLFVITNLGLRIFRMGQFTRA